MVYCIEKKAHFTVEKYIECEFKKWSNNIGEKDDDIYSNTLDSFSHWTYCATNKYLLVSDLQGFIIKSKNLQPDEFLLTDPAILCPQNMNRFSVTNLGIKAVEEFFKKHRCNSFCIALKLQKHKLQTLDDRISGGTITPILKK